jgi:DNA-binding transcriptional LysR family regulator
VSLLCFHGETMNTLSRMETFARVAEARSFSDAARRLGLSKGAVSKAIAALESELGSRLLNRSTRNVTLTEAGEVFLRSCQSIVAEAENAERAVRELSDTPRGLLRVNTSTAFAARWLAPALPAFFDRHPGMQVELEGMDAYVDAAHGGWDVVIRFGRLVDSGLITRKLALMRCALAASPDYLARRGTPRRPEDLKDHDCVTYTVSNPADRWTLHRRGQKLSVRVGGHLRTNLDATTVAAMVAGQGIGSLPMFTIANELRSGALQVVLPGWEAGQAIMHALMPPARAGTAKVRAFVDFLVERFAREAFWEVA